MRLAAFLFPAPNLKIGVVCDTHNNVRSVRCIVELFKTAKVDRVVHTGDITKGSTLDIFGELGCPLFGVFGNNDVERASLAESIARCHFEFQEPPLHLRWHKREILVVHDPAILAVIDTSRFDLVLHGHTHLKRVERTERGLIFNPGECAGQMVGYNAVGVVDLSNLAVELLNF